MDRLPNLKCQEHSHEEEDIIAVCMKKDCQFPSRLMCVSCLTSDHCDHGRFGMKINEFNSMRNQNDIIFNWKGDNDISAKMISGLKKFQTEIDPSKIIEELDAFESKIIEEIKSLRKQILTNLNTKKEQGDEEYQKVLNELQEFLQVTQLQKLLSPQVSSMSQQNLESNLSNKEIHSQISKIIKEQNDSNSKSYQSCINLMFNSDCIYSYSLNLDTLHEEQIKIQQKIKRISTAIQKPSLAYDSPKTIKISGENNILATFTNTSSYSVAYLNVPFKMDQKPVEIVFSFETGLNNKHFCIGLRKESLKNEESYNKSPYKCFHCQNGDGVSEDTGIINSIFHRSNVVAVQFIPRQNLLYLLCDKSKCKLIIPFENKNDLFRLYFWRVGNPQSTTIKILSVAQL